MRSSIRPSITQQQSKHGEIRSTEKVKKRRKQVRNYVGFERELIQNRVFFLLGRKFNLKREFIANPLCYCKDVQDLYFSGCCQQHQIQHEFIPFSHLTQAKTTYLAASGLLCLSNCKLSLNYGLFAYSLRYLLSQTHPDPSPQA